MPLSRLIPALLILTLVVWADPAPAAMLTDDLVAYWALEEPAGPRADSAGSSHLTDHHTVTQTAGIKGHAAQFTKADAEFLSTPDQAALRTGDIDFTLAAWAYFDSKIPAEPNTVVIAGKWADVTREYMLLYESGKDRLRFQMGDGAASSTGVVDADTFGPPPLNVWLFIVASHHAATSRVAIQVNNGTVDSAGDGGTPGASSSLFFIGAREDTPGHSLEFWDGRIDEVGLWKRLLTPEERTALYEHPGELVQGAPPDAAIPEASSLSLFGSGLLGLIGRKRTGRSGAVTTMWQGVVKAMVRTTARYCAVTRT